MLVLTTPGKVHFATKGITEPLWIKLFVNYVPNKFGSINTLTLSDMLEASGGGYNKKPLLTANWNYSITDNIVQITHTNVVWNFTGALSNPPGGEIYGYYITNYAEDELLIVDRWPVYFHPSLPEHFYEVIPILTYSTIVDS